MSKIFITTTNSIEGATIEQYLGIVSTNKVIGTNFFSDLDASLTDLFGGNSSTYQRKLDLIYKQAMEALSDKAKMRGANGIIGLQIDFDEVSGKGKSMFMVSALGTAVIISKPKERKLNGDKHFLSTEDLTQSIKRKTIIKKINNNETPDEEDWQFLQACFIPEVAEALLVPYLKTIAIYDTLKDRFPQYFAQLDKDLAEKILYPHLLIRTQAVLNLARIAHIFSPKAIKENIANQNFEFATLLLDIDKEMYGPEDIVAFEEIISILDNLPDLGHYEVVKGIFSKPEERYICPMGHRSSKMSDFCEVSECNKNIKGLNEKQAERIEIFRLKLESLKEYFNNNN